MAENSLIFLLVLFSMAVGFIIAEIANGQSGKNALPKTEKEMNEEEKADVYNGEEKEADPMSLRNGYGVTKDKNPTFAEQWVNIMNYCGESQTEDGYEEENDYPAGYLG